MSGLVAGLVALLVTAVIATVLGIYCYKAKNKGGQRSVQYVDSDVNIYRETLFFFAQLTRDVE